MRARSGCAVHPSRVASAAVKVRRVRTRRSNTSALTVQGITSPRTGAGLKLPFASASDGGELAVQRSYKRGMGKFPTHVHFEFAERFEVISGGAVAVLDGDEQRLVASALQTGLAFRSVLYIPPGVPHVNPYNFDCDELVLRQSFSTATDGVRTYVETLAEVMADGRDDDGELPWPLVLAIARISGEQIYVTPAVRRRPRGPRWSFQVQRRFLQPAGGVVAGTWDYRVQLPPRLPLTNPDAPTALHRS
jgi:hypothetical protein